MFAKHPEAVGQTVERLYGRILLGPLPCQVCGKPVTWDGMDWYFAGTMLLHRRETCPGVAEPAEDAPGARGGLHFSKRPQP